MMVTIHGYPIRSFVRLRSGGPRMQIVEKVTRHNGAMIDVCVWNKPDGSLGCGEFDERMLWAEDPS